MDWEKYLESDIGEVKQMGSCMFDLIRFMESRELDGGEDVNERYEEIKYLDIDEFLGYFEEEVANTGQILDMAIRQDAPALPFIAKKRYLSHQEILAGTGRQDLDMMRASGRIPLMEMERRRRLRSEEVRRKRELMRREDFVPFEQSETAEKRARGRFGEISKIFSIFFGLF